MPSVTDYITNDDDPDGEIVVVLEYTATPFVAAQIQGPPENCYPAEGGPEADSMTVDKVPVAMYSSKWSKLTETMLEMASEAMQTKAEDDASAYGDYLYEQQKDRDLDAWVEKSNKETK